MIPGGADAALRFASDVCADPAGTVRRWQTVSGRRAVGCFPVGTAAELLHAAGILPVHLWGDEYPVEPSATVPLFPCPILRSLYASIRKSRWSAIDAWTIPSGCDLLRFASGILEAMSNVGTRCHCEAPSGDGTSPPIEAYLDGVESFREWAAEISGRTVNEGDLERSVRVFNENRRLFVRLGERLADDPGSVSAVEYLHLARSGMALPPETHSELLREVLEKRAKAVPRPAAKVFLAGVLATESVMGALDRSGGAVVGDDLLQGRRHFDLLAEEKGDLCLSLARCRLEADSARRYRTEDRADVDRLFSRMTACGADRLLFLRVPGCLLTSQDDKAILALSRNLGFPVLCLDVDPLCPDPARYARRIEAFLESGR